MANNHYVQYIVVRRDLVDKHGIGMLAAQICHASMAPVTNQIRGADGDTSIDATFDKDTKRWIRGTFNKRVMEVPNEQALLGLRERLYHEGIVHSEIRESALGGELTCIGLKPYNNGRVSQYFKGLNKLGDNGSDKS